MAELNGFNAEEVPTSTGFDPIPAGTYRVMIVASERKPNKAGTGSYISMTLEVMDGALAGRKLFEVLNLENPNAQAVEIARATLSQICHAVGVLRPRDTEELHGKPMMASVLVKKDRGSDELRNRIAKFSPVNGAPAASGAAAGASAPQQSTPPWKR